MQPDVLILMSRLPGLTLGQNGYFDQIIVTPGRELTVVLVSWHGGWQYGSTCYPETVS